ncbi:unnamed protein product [Polarella glacialis]|uniref:Uncharacterized protein n=1 Tax=Polarella glacialis TaxID=89957 RepID=A0A813JLP5_POLGL|nr:unnamed protein product [Polarella glacialis]
MESPAKRPKRSAPLRFRKADGVDLIVGSETFFMPFGAMEHIPKLHRDLTNVGSGKPLCVDIGNCSLDMFEELLAYAMCKYLGKTDEYALWSNWEAYACPAELKGPASEAVLQRAHENFSKALDLLVLGLQFGLEGIFKAKLLKAVRDAMPPIAEDFQKMRSACALLPACEDLVLIWAERPSDVLGELGKCWEVASDELFIIFLDCWRLDLKDVVLRASRRRVTCNKAPSVLLAFLRKHGGDIGAHEAQHLVEHIAALFFVDNLQFKLLVESDKAYFFTIAEGEDLRRRVLDIEYSEGPYIKLPETSILKALQANEVKLFCDRLVLRSASREG